MSWCSRCLGGKYSAGTAVDVWLNDAQRDAWWPGEVLACEPRGEAGQCHWLVKVRLLQWEEQGAEEMWVEKFKLPQEEKSIRLRGDADHAEEDQPHKGGDCGNEGDGSRFSTPTRGMAAVAPELASATPVNRD